MGCGQLDLEGLGGRPVDFVGGLLTNRPWNGTDWAIHRVLVLGATHFHTIGNCSSNQVLHHTQVRNGHLHTSLLIPKKIRNTVARAAECLRDLLRAKTGDAMELEIFLCAEWGIVLREIDRTPSQGFW